MLADEFFLVSMPMFLFFEWSVSALNDFCGQSLGCRSPNSNERVLITFADSCCSLTGVMELMYGSKTRLRLMAMATVLALPSLASTERPKSNGEFSFSTLPRLLAS